MKIARFNINNINRRLPNLPSWLREAGPDIVCLQDLKAADTEFPADAIRQAGYHAVWRGEKRWNGVAILAQWTPVMSRVDLPGDASGGQCRDLEGAVNGVLVASAYAPNGTPSRPQIRIQGRLAKVAAGDVRAPLLDGRALVRILWLDRATIGRLTALRGPGESYGVIIRVARANEEGAWPTQDADAVAFMLRFEDRKREWGARR
jgi:hypothetical protein